MYEFTSLNVDRHGALGVESTTQAGLRWQDWPQATDTHADAENVGADGTADDSFGTAAPHYRRVSGHAGRHSEHEERLM